MYYDSVSGICEEKAGEKQGNSGSDYMSFVNDLDLNFLWCEIVFQTIPF